MPLRRRCRRGTGGRTLTHRETGLARQQYDTQAALVRQYEAQIVADQANA